MLAVVTWHPDLLDGTAATGERLAGILGAKVAGAGAPHDISAERNAKVEQRKQEEETRRRIVEEMQKKDADRQKREEAELGEKFAGEAPAHDEL